MFAQTKVDSLNVMKNEIGINLIPIVNMGNQSYNDKAIANIFYKRQLKNSWFGRASLILFSDNNSPNNNLTVINALPNSKLSIRYTQSNPKKYLQYNIGIEKRFGKSKIIQFTGCDLGYAHYKRENKKMFGIRDSIENNSPYNYNQNGFLNQFRNDSVILHQIKVGNALVFTPFYGLQFNISKHFFFSAQAGIALSVIKENNKSIIDNQKNKNYVGTTTNFNLDVTGVTCNFSICYRF